MRELLKQNPQLEQKYFTVGTAYNDADIIKDLGGKSVPNTFIMPNIVSYSDKAGEDCFRVDVGNESQSRENKRINGVFDISYEDTWPVAYLEEKIFKHQENAPERVDGVIHLQNVLIGSAYAAIKNETPNLNLGYFDKKGVLRGYFIGYPVKNKLGEIGVYFDYMAAEKDYRKGAVKMLYEMVRRVKSASEVLKRNSGQEKIKIYMDNRIETSYPLVKTLAKRYGLKILEDIGVDDNMQALVLEY